MPKGKRTDNKTVADIITSYALTNNYNQTAKDIGVSSNTVKRIILKQKKEHPEELAKVVADKKDEFIEKSSRIIDKALNKLEKQIDDGNVPANHLTTVIGTLYDKRALAKGEATENTTFKVDIEVIE